MLAGRQTAGAFFGVMKPFGMRLEVISETVGTAAATKMFRSIIVKGLEALMLECVFGTPRRTVRTSASFRHYPKSFQGSIGSVLANYMVNRVVVHGERRAREMEEVSETLESLASNP